MTALAHSHSRQPASLTTTRALVLIADPWPGTWTGVRAALTTLGVHSRLATTSAEALRLARDHHPAVCLVALGLAPMGYRQLTAVGVACALRQLDPPPTVALTWPFPAGKTQVGGGGLLPMLDTTRHDALIALILAYADWRPGP